MPELVTVGVPVYRGELYVEETLHCIQNQTHTEIEVIISLDEADPKCEEICSKFLTDSRFRMVIQPDRLGWAGNISWLMSQAKGDFWYFHQQDDITADNYIEILLDYARQNTQAAVVYCDMVAFGTHEGPILVQPSVLGPPFMRQMAVLHAPHHAVAFRGLTRVGALRQAGPVPTNRYENFACDTAWVAAAAVCGELHRLPAVLYHKRFHGASAHLPWMAWDKNRRIAAWSSHCVNMLEQALRIEATTQQRRLLWLSAIERLLSAGTAGYYLQLDDLTLDDCEQGFEAFFEGARSSQMQDVSSLLGASWDELYESGRRFMRLALPQRAGLAPDAGKVSVDTAISGSQPLRPERFTPLVTDRKASLLRGLRGHARQLRRVFGPRRD